MGTHILIAIFLFSTWSQLHAAACCGARAAMPTLISGDYRAQMSLSASNAAVTHTADANGQWNKRNGANQEVQETLTISGAYLLTPFWQISGQLPFKKNTHKTVASQESSTSMGDISFSASYEILPEYAFSRWRPRGFIFLTQTIPTARSTYEAQRRLGTDAMGRGFFSTSLGAALMKVIGKGDLFWMGEYHRGQARTFDGTNGDLRVDPNDGYSTVAGVGISPGEGNWRFGTSIGFNQENPVTITPAGLGTPDKKYVWEVGLNVSHFVEQYSVLLNYNDQTFMKKAHNSNLSKSAGLSLVRFFDL